VRVLEKGSEGVLVTRQLDPGRFPELVKEAREMALSAPADPYRQIASAITSGPTLAIDETLFLSPSEAALDQFHDLEKRVLALDKRIKKIVKFHFAETRAEYELRTAAGVKSSSKFSDTRFVAEILAEEQGETEVAWDSASVRFGRDLNIDNLAIDLAQHAVGALGGRAIPTGNYAVVLAPRVGVQILELISEALSAQAVQMGRSFLAGQKGQMIGSLVLTIVDDPLLPMGVASTGADDEGITRTAFTPVAEGMLTDFFYDLRTAAREGRSTNGRGHRSTVGSSPAPSATNLYVRPGKSSVINMLAAAESVFLVRDVMGLHMADRITGEFSLGAAGVLYKNGVASQAVRGVTMAGTVSEVLKKVQTVGNDFRWYGSLGCPSLFIRSLSIAGV
jgi:PmbA protein